MWYWWLYANPCGSSTRSFWCHRLLCCQGSECWCQRCQRQNSHDDWYRNDLFTYILQYKKPFQHFGMGTVLRFWGYWPSWGLVCHVLTWRMPIILFIWQYWEETQGCCQLSSDKLEHQIYHGVWQTIREMWNTDLFLWTFFFDSNQFIGLIGFCFSARKVCFWLNSWKKPCFHNFTIKGKTPLDLSKETPRLIRSLPPSARFAVTRDLRFNKNKNNFIR